MAVNQHWGTLLITVTNFFLVCVIFKFVCIPLFTSSISLLLNIFLHIPLTLNINHSCNRYTFGLWWYFLEVVLIGESARLLTDFQFSFFLIQLIIVISYYSANIPIGLFLKKYNSDFHKVDRHKPHPSIYLYTVISHIIRLEPRHISSLYGFDK